MYSFLLIIHIFIGIADLLFCIAGVRVSFGSNLSKIKSFQSMIWKITIIELGSGAVLIVANPSIATRFCVSLGVYMLLILGVQALLHVKSRRFSLVEI